MNRKILFTLISLIVCIALHAQNTPTHKISGSIIDSSSREAVPFANISLTQNDSIIAGGISDDNGNFKIAATAGQYTLCISFIGYKNHCEQIVLNQDTYIGMIELGRDATMLSDVVISQSLTERRGDRLVVNLASSPLVEGKNTRDILNYTPGVHIDNRGTVSINGVQNVRVMINDRDVKMSGDELLSYLESINASDILKIEIIPMAGAEYEADSAGGVIHITLKKKALEGVNATVGMSYTQGIYPVLSPWIKAAWRKDRLSINARYNYNYNQSVNSLEEWTDYLLTGTHHTSTTQVIGKSQSHYATIDAVYDLTSHSEIGLAVEYNTSNTNSTTTGNTIQEGHSGIMTIPNNFTEHGPYDMVNLTAYYRIKVDTLGSYLKIMADYTSRDRSSSVHSASEYIQNGNIIKSNIYDYLSPTYIDLYSLRADYDKKTRGKISWSIGGKYSISDISSVADYRSYDAGNWIEDDPRDNTFTYRENVLAGYGKMNISLPHMWAATLGVRIEHTHLETHSLTMEEKDSQDFTDIFPQVSIMKSFGEKKNHSLSFNYTRRLSRPSYSIYNPYMMPITEFSSIVGNPDIRPSYINRYSLTGVLSGKYSLTAMYNSSRGDVAQMVMSDPQNPDKTIYQHVNMGRSSQWILSLYTPVKITSWYGIDLNATAYYMEQGYEDNTSYNVATNAYIQNNFTWKKGWSATISAWGVTRQKQANMVVDPMWGMDISVVKKCLDNRLVFSLNATDIFNTMHNVIYSHGDDFSKKTISRWESQGVSLSVRWNFINGKKSKTKTVESGDSEQRDRL